MIKLYKRVEGILCLWEYLLRRNKHKIIYSNVYEFQINRDIQEVVYNITYRAKDIL